MVNSIDNYEKWESIVGKRKILPAFPGAGGSITNNILDASLTPRIIQPTTFSEITGKKTNRTQRLSKIFAQFKKIVALSNLIQRIYHNDIRNMLP